MECPKCNKDGMEWDGRAKVFVCYYRNCNHVVRMTGTFKDRIRKVRVLRKMTQCNLAGVTGLQPSAISHFETGNRVPNLANLRTLAIALNVSADYLLGISDFKES